MFMVNPVFDRNRFRVQVHHVLDRQKNKGVP